MPNYAISSLVSTKILSAGGSSGKEPRKSLSVSNTTASTQPVSNHLAGKKEQKNSITLETSLTYIHLRTKINRKFYQGFHAGEISKKEFIQAIRIKKELLNENEMKDMTCLSNGASIKKSGSNGIYWYGFHDNINYIAALESIKNNGLTVDDTTVGRNLDRLYPYDVCAENYRDNRHAHIKELEKLKQKIIPHKDSTSWSTLLDNLIKMQTVKIQRTELLDKQKFHPPGGFAMEWLWDQVSLSFANSVAKATFLYPAGKKPLKNSNSTWKRIEEPMLISRGIQISEVEVPAFQLFDMPAK